MKDIKINPITTKILIMFAVTLALLFPLNMIGELTNARMQLQNKATTDIEKSIGGAVKIAGPYLIVPHESVTTKELVIFPKTMDSSVDLRTEELQKGIYSVPVFTSIISMNSLFSIDEAKSQHPEYDWFNAKLVFEIAEKKGIAQRPVITLDGQTLAMKPNSSDSQNKNNYFQTAVNLLDQVQFGLNLSVHLRGVSHFRQIPSADQSTIEVSSDWKSPKLEGDFIASARDINESGSSATWNIASINSGLVDFMERNSVLSSSLISSDMSYIQFTLFQEESVYQKTHRTIEYGILIIVIAFLAIFLFDLRSKRSLSTLHYIVTGAGIALFFLLLLAFSEFINYGLAYLTASLAIIWVLSFYYGSIHKNIKKGWTMACLYSCIFALIYFVIVSIEYALLAGSISLLVIFYVTAIMTRNTGIKKIEE